MNEAALRDIEMLTIVDHSESGDPARDAELDVLSP